MEGQLGLEPTFQEYITKLCDIFDEVKRVLRKDGTCWVNLGDTYSNSGKGGDSSKIYAKRHTEFGKISDIRQHGKPTRVKDLPTKCLCQIPSRFAIEMTNRGWILRNRLIWWKPNCMPSSVKDKFTVDYEDLFFFVKNKKYWFETQYEKLAPITQERLKSGKWESDKKSKYKHGKHPMSSDSFNKAIKKMAETGKRNKRAVWKIETKPYSEAHFAVYPEKLISTPIKAGCPLKVCKNCGKAAKSKECCPHYGSDKGFELGIVLDPFMGSGTTAKVARFLGRNYIGIELNPDYIKLAEKRLSQQILI